MIFIKKIEEWHWKGNWVAHSADYSAIIINTGEGKPEDLVKRYESMMERLNYKKDKEKNEYIYNEEFTYGTGSLDIHSGNILIYHSGEPWAPAHVASDFFGNLQRKGEIFYLDMYNNQTIDLPDNLLKSFEEHFFIKGILPDFDDHDDELYAINYSVFPAVMKHTDQIYRLFEIFVNSTNEFKTRLYVMNYLVEIYQDKKFIDHEGVTINDFMQLPKSNLLKSFKNHLCLNCTGLKEIEYFREFKETKIYYNYFLDLSGYGLERIPNSNFSHNITTLDLSSNKLTKLNQSDFYGLTNLTVLKLNNNKLETLTEDVFDNLDKLRILYLNNNEIVTLPEKIFSKLTNLEAVYLNDNVITNLPDDIFNLNIKLDKVYLKENLLKGIPISAFSSNIYTLEISQNEISDRLITLASTNLRSLKLIQQNDLTPYLLDFKIQYRQYGSRGTTLFFNGQHQLLKIRLNNDVRLNADILFQFVSIFFASEIEIIGNGKIELDDDLFDKLASNQKSESIYGIYLIKIGGTLDSLLSKLNRFKNLRKLFVSHAKIAQIPANIETYENLNYLTIRFCNIDNINSSLINYSKLVSLDLSHNNLCKLPDDFVENSNLVNLNLSCNQINRFPNFIFNLHRLQSLILSNNKIKEIPKDIAKLTSLLNLRSNNNQIEKIPVESEKLFSLQYLDLSYNEIEEIDSIANLYKLKKLNLIKNKITKLPVFGMTNDDIKWILFDENPSIGNYPRNYLKISKQTTSIGRRIPGPIQHLIYCSKLLNMVNYFNNKRVFVSIVKSEYITIDHILIEFKEDYQLSHEELNSLLSGSEINVVEITGKGLKSLDRDLLENLDSQFKVLIIRDTLIEKIPYEFMYYSPLSRLELTSNKISKEHYDELQLNMKITREGGSQVFIDFSE